MNPLVDISCGCGKEGRYMVTKDDEVTYACNKYMRCPTRKELEDLVVSLRGEIKKVETENLVMITLLSGIAAGNNSRKDAAQYIKSMLKLLSDTSPEESE